jgi:hypothetical protein
MGDAQEHLTIEGAAEIFRDAATPERGIYARAKLSTVGPEELHAVRTIALPGTSRIRSRRYSSDVAGTPARQMQKVALAHPLARVGDARDARRFVRKWGEHFSAMLTVNK